MRAVQFEQYGDPGVLHVGDAPDPHAGPGQVRIAVEASGVNPFDWKVRSGMLEGRDAARPPPRPRPRGGRRRRRGG